MKGILFSCIQPGFHGEKLPFLGSLSNVTLYLLSRKTFANIFSLKCAYGNMFYMEFCHVVLYLNLRTLSKCYLDFTQTSYP